MNETQDIVFDTKGNVIQVGDIVYRAKHSALTIHRVENITKKSLVLSCIMIESTWGHRATPYRYRGDTRTIESIGEHNDTFYFSKYNVKESIIKY